MSYRSPVARLSCISAAIRRHRVRPHGRFQCLIGSDGRRAERASLRTKPIEDVKLGDLVWAWDDQLGRLVRQRVRQLVRHERQAIVTVEVAGEAGATQHIEATAGHPFWVEGEGWVAAQSLQPGQRLRCIDGNKSLHVAAVFGPHRLAAVYNFEVAEAHNYYVGFMGVLVHNISTMPNAAAKDLRGFTGAVIAGENFVPEAGSLAHWFIENTLQNNSYASPAHLERRARSFADFHEVSAGLSQRTAAELADPGRSTAAARQNDHLVEQLRRFWDRPVFNEDGPALRERIAETFKGKIWGAADSVFGIIVRGAKGPLTIEQNNHAFELLNGTKLALERFGGETPELVSLIRAEKAGRVKTVNPPELGGTRRNGHITQSRGGVDLSADPGTALADRYGMPVMNGTSGSSSIIATMARYVSRSNGSSWMAPGLTEVQARQAMIDLGHHYMGPQVNGPAVAARVNDYRVRIERAAPKSVESSRVFTHSYNETSVAIDMTLRGQRNDDRIAIDGAYQRALLRLVDERWSVPSEQSVDGHP